MSTLIITSKVEAGAIARRFASADPDQALTREMRGSTIPGLIRAYQEVSPYRTGRLRRNIGSRGGGRVVDIVSTVRSDDDYPYTGVTRFGHRAGRIYPKHGKALAFKIGGRVIIRASVKGYQPDHDWADDARPKVLEVLQSAGGRVNRELVRQLT